MVNRSFLPSNVNMTLAFIGSVLLLSCAGALVIASPSQRKATVTIATAQGTMQMDCSGPVMVETPIQYK